MSHFSDSVEKIVQNDYVMDMKIECRIKDLD